MSNGIHKLNWHDGQLVELTFAMSEKGVSSAILALNLYSVDFDAATERVKFSIECIDVLRLNTSLDGVELKDNRNAGNISNGYLRNDCLWLYLCDGVIEIRAKRFRVRKRT